MHESNSIITPESLPVNPRYYSGQNVSDNAPKPIPGCETFSQFVTEHLSRPTVSHVTSAVYHGMDDKARKTIKNGRYFTAAAFGGEGLRRIRNITAAHMLVLDLDTGAQPLLDADLETLLPWNYCLFTTLTSTPEAPRLRLVVDSEPLTVEQYRAGVAWLAKHLSLEAPNPNPESLDVCHLWFFPSAFLDRSTEIPIISSRINGQPISPLRWGIVEENDPDLPPSQPVEGASLEQAEEMLLFLDPDTEGYAAWIKVGMALRHQFGSDALPLWDKWSQRGTKYTTPQDIKDKWKSFKGSTNEPVTYRSLIKRAKHHGWTTEASRIKCEKLISLSTSVEDLLGPILASIRDGVFSKSDRDILVNKIRARALTAHEAKLRLSTVREAMNDASKRRAVIPSELQGWVYVGEPNQWVQPATGLRFSPTAFDLTFSRIATSVEALNTLGLRRVGREGYDPSRPNDLIFKDKTGVDTLNTYRCSYPEADPHTAPLAGKIFNAHLTLLFPQEFSREMLLSWMTWTLTHPGKRCHWGVFIQGGQGCGKSLIAEAFAVCFGPTNARKVSNDMMVEKFNSWIGNTQLLFFEEVMVGERQKDLMEKIKDLITGSTANIRAMRTDAVERANLVSAIIFLSNHLSGIRLDRGDRRIFCLVCAQQQEQQVRAIPREHFEQLARLKEDLAGGFRSYLLNRPISPAFDPFGHAPLTVDRDLVMKAGASELDCAVNTAIESGDYDLVTPEVLCSSLLHAAVRSEVRYASAKRIGQILTEMGWVKLGQRLLTTGERHCIWWNPEKLNGVTPLERINAIIAAKELA